MGQRGGDGEGALHPPRELAKRGVALVYQPETGQQFLGPPGALVPWHPIELHREDQVAESGQFVIEIGGFRHDTDALLDLR